MLFINNVQHADKLTYFIVSQSNLTENLIEQKALRLFHIRHQVTKMICSYK